MFDVGPSVYVLSLLILSVLWQLWQPLICYNTNSALYNIFTRPYTI